jgi:hypothetical protein
MIDSQISIVNAGTVLRSEIAAQVMIASKPPRALTAESTTGRIAASLDASAW